MKNILIIILIIALLGGGLYYFNLERKNESIVEENTPDNDIAEDTAKDPAVDENQEVEDESIEGTADTAVNIASGKEAPNFTLKNLKGEEISLSDYRGKIVLINFWTTWCKWCDVEMPDLDRFNKENDDLVVLAVNVEENKETVEEYINKGGYEFEVVLDEDGQIARTYLVNGFPNSYFIDKEGILIGRAPGMITYEQMNTILEEIR